MTTKVGVLEASVTPMGMLPSIMSSCLARRRVAVSCLHALGPCYNLTLFFWLLLFLQKCPATCPPCMLCTGAASNYQCVKDTSLSCQLSELVDDTVSALSEVIGELLGVMQAQAGQGQQAPQQAEKQLQTQLETLQALQEVAAGMLKADTAKPQGSPAPAPQVARLCWLAGVPC